MTKRLILSTVLAVTLSLVLALPLGAIPNGVDPFLPDLDGTGWFEGRISVRLVNEDGSRSDDHVRFGIVAVENVIGDAGAGIASITEAILLLWFRGSDVDEDPADLAFGFAESVRGYLGEWDALRGRPSLVLRMYYLPWGEIGEFDGDATLEGSIRMNRRTGAPQAFRGTLTLYVVEYFEVPLGMVSGTGRANLRWVEGPLIP